MISSYHQHVLKVGHCINFEETRFVAVEGNEIKSTVREVLEMERHLNNMNKMYNTLPII